MKSDSDHHKHVVAENKEYKQNSKYFAKLFLAITNWIVEAYEQKHSIDKCAQSILVHEFGRVKLRFIMRLADVDIA